MEKQIKRQVFTLVGILIPFLSVIIYGLYVVKQEDELLKKEPVYTSAIIVETYVIKRTRHFVKFEFKSGAAIYDGHARFFPNIETIKVGDTCEVVYARSNPEVNKLLKTEDKRIKMKQTPVNNLEEVKKRIKREKYPDLQE